MSKHPDRNRPGTGPEAGGETASARPSLEPSGERLGQYLLLERLGQGGMGTVYKAFHTRLKRVVALKVLRADRLQDAQLLNRFNREMEAVGKLDDPHIVRATDAGEAGGRHFLAMEFIDGPDLARLGQRCGRLTVADSCELVRQAALGLQSAHEHGLVHRDIKPSNLVLAPGGCVKVLDMGLARLHGSHCDDEALTGSGQVLGTADYMAPEQGTDGRNVDIRADVYALGCTLFKLLTGRAPFDGPETPSWFGKLKAHAEAPVPSLRERRDDAPDGLVVVLNRLLAKDPADRYAVPAEVAAALQPFAAGADLLRLLEAFRVLEGVRGSDMPPAPAEPSAPSAQLTETKSHGPLPDHPGAASPADAPTATRSVARPRRWWGAATAAALVAAALAGLAITFLILARQRPSPPADADPSPAHPALEPPGRWHELLDRKPVVLDWRRPSGASRWDFKEGEHELWVTADGEGLFGLGETVAAAYEIEVGVEQIRWGGVGLFFGRHDDRFQDKPCQKCQMVQLVSHFEGTPAESIALDHGVIYQFGEAAQVAESFGSAAVPWPTSHEHRLKITVGKTGLRSVHWDGAEVQALTPINASLHDADCRGAFGVWIARSSGVFRNAKYRTLSEEP